MEIYLPNNKTGVTSKIFVPVRKSRINLVALLEDFDNNDDADYMIVVNNPQYYSTTLSMRLSFQHAIDRRCYNFKIMQRERIPDRIFIFKNKNIFKITMDKIPSNIIWNAEFNGKIYTALVGGESNE